MGQINPETVLAINVVLGLCLQHVCCPFLSLFSSKWQTAFLAHQFILICGKAEVLSFFFSLCRNSAEQGVWWHQSWKYWTKLCRGFWAWSLLQARSLCVLSGIISKYPKDRGLIKGLLKPAASAPAGCGDTAGRSPGEAAVPSAAVARRLCCQDEPCERANHTGLVRSDS